MELEIRTAQQYDCFAIAELALMAGEGIPAHFWESGRTGDEPIEAVGARNAASEDENFSYRNAHLALIDGKIAGMLLAYRLPASEESDDLNELPEFIRPLVELEQCVPDSFYINMVASYPEFRSQGVGTALMGVVDQLAVDAGCDTVSIEVFDQNEGALRLYQRLGFDVIETRPVIPHPCHPYTGNIVLLTRPVN